MNLSSPLQRKNSSPYGYTQNGFMWNFVCVIVFVVVLYQIRYGLQMLVPTYDTWLMHHDWATHYLGWFFYRNEPWTFPLGQIERYFYPVGTNVAFTDSIPLMAIPFKLLSPILPDKFQYIGLWLFSCHILLGYFSLKLFERFSITGLPQLFAALLIVVNPVMLHRFIHPALCTHWLLVASIWVYFGSASVKGSRKILFHQFIILILSGLINPYMCAMVSLFVVAVSFRLYVYDKSIQFIHFLLYNILSFFVLLLVFYLVGFFTFKSQGDLGIAGAYGLYAMNLNSLYNSSGFSAILPDFKMVSWHQYESFLYLGFGIILLMLIAFILALNNIHDVKRKFNIGINLVPLGVLTLIVTAFAVTNVITLNDHVLFSFYIPSALSKIGDIFRASARFFWVTYYLILFSLLIYFIRTASYLVSTSVMLIIFGLQLYDYKLLSANQNLNYDSYDSPLNEKYWSILVEKSSQVIFCPPLATTYQSDQDYRFFCYLAAKYHKPINIGYVARQDNKAVSNYTEGLYQSLEKGEIDENAVYVSTLASSDRFYFIYHVGGVTALNLDQYLVFFSKALFDQSHIDTLEANSQPLPESLSHRTVFSSFNFGKKDAPGNIISGIDQLKNLEKYVTIAGWASIEDKKNPAADPIKIILKSRDGNLFAVDTKTSIRKDVSDYFKNSAMDSTGFNVTFFTDSLEKGSYEMALYIEDHQSKVGTYRFINRINIGYADYFEIEQFKDELIPLEINHGIDIFVDSAKVLKIAGWAALPNRDATACQIRILFKGTDGVVYASPTNNTQRPDVTKYFMNKYKLDDSGFDASISKKRLGKGTYQIGIYIRYPEQNQSAAYFTDRYIEK